MKKKIWLSIVIIVFLILVLFIPVPKSAYKDGGTREYVSLTYKIVDWNRIHSDGVYKNTRIYFGNDRKKSIDELWKMEAVNSENKFNATVLEIKDNTVLVEPIAYEPEALSANKIMFSVSDLEPIEVSEGSVVQITYKGCIMESYPAKINAVSWQICYDLRHLEYKDSWLNKSAAVQKNNNCFSDIRITKIYSNCFFATTVIPQPYEIKLNGNLGDEWCVGDQIICTYENVYFDELNLRYEADFKDVRSSDFKLDPNACYKPVIYLYPKVKTKAEVTLTVDGTLTCTYPRYNNGWNVTAYPDGTISDANGQTYNYLYWEGNINTFFDLSKGFCIKGEDTAEFLEDSLSKLGLNRKEANEFIVYWLPLMEKNEYNIISFQNECYTGPAKLQVKPTPDTVIRVFMTWQKSKSYKEIPGQKLTAPKRNGFTVVEWGGTEIS